MRVDTPRASAPIVATTATTSAASRRTSVVLWTVQALLAALFLFAGGSKLVMPIAEMTKQIALPGAFLRFIGVCEIAGALGLVLPGIFRVRQSLTPLAAAGLVVIMIGAASVCLVATGAASALVPVVVGLLCASVAYGRGGRLHYVGASRPTRLAARDVRSGVIRPAAA